MFGVHPSIKAIEVRKQLLKAEADVYRLQLRQEVESIRDGLHAWTIHAKSAGAVVSAAGRAAAAVSEFRDTMNSRRKPSFISKIVSGARMASVVWQALRSRDDKGE